MRGKILFAAVTVFGGLMARSTTVVAAPPKSDTDDYWRRHWAWYDDTYRPYSMRQSHYGTPIGGGSYHYDADLHSRTVTPLGGGSFHADPSLRRQSYSTPIGGGSFHADTSLRNQYRHYGTPIGGGSYHAPRPTVGQRQPLSYGWW